jgi:hypothetical protein
MPYKVLFAGLACFHANSSQDVIALLPDGRDVSGARHLASIGVRTRDVLDDSRWPEVTSRGDMTTFPITRPVSLSLPIAIRPSSGLITRYLCYIP